MTYYSIFFRNMRRNIKNYTIYLMSTVFSVVVYYLFAAIKYNPNVTGVVGSNANMSGLFNFTGGIVIIFAMIFIGYSNAFFVKRRKKEIALYALMGMKKKKITMSLVIENICIACASLVIGIGLGTLFSKLFIMALLKMLNDVVAVGFQFSMGAAKETIILFTIIFIIASINSHKVIKSIKLIELFAAAKKTEQHFRTRPVYAIISFGLVAFGYWLSQNMLNPMLLINMLVVLATVITGTYGLFAYFLGYFIRILKGRKKTFYKGNNILAISNINYRIKNHSVTLATIAILSATTIAALGMADSLYYDFNTSSQAKYPFTYAYSHQGEELDQLVLDQVNSSQEVELKGSMVLDRATVTGRYLGVFDSNYGQMMRDYNDPSKLHLISNSQYNTSMALRDMDKMKVALQPDEGVLILGYFYSEDYSDFIHNAYELSLQEKEAITQVRVMDVREQAIVSSNMSDYMVVSDQVYSDYVTAGAPVSRYTCIKTTNQLNSKQLTSDLQKLVPEEAHLSAYYRSYRSANHTFALLAFTAFFVSVVFLLSTGSIIYFKLITEANDEKERYTILKKIGVSRKDIRRSVKKQIFGMFLVPLVVGLCHSAFALKAFGDLLGAQILTPVVLTMAGYSVIYFMYYGLTVNYYKKIIMN